MPTGPSRSKAVSERIWHDSRFAGLSDGARLYYLYLATTWDTTMFGVNWRPYGAIGASFAVTGEQLAEWRNSFMSCGLVEAVGPVLYLPAFLVDNRPPRPSAIKEWRQEWIEMPAGDYRGELYLRVLEALEPLGDLYTDALKLTLPEHAGAPRTIPAAQDTLFGVSPEGKKQVRATEKAALKTVWDFHCTYRRRYFHKRQPIGGYVDPSLTPRIASSIKQAISIHGLDKARDAGAGIFFSTFHTGQQRKPNGDPGDEFLEPHLCWRITGHTDNVERFARLFREAVTKFRAQTGV